MLDKGISEYMLLVYYIGSGKQMLENSVEPISTEVRDYTTFALRVGNTLFVHNFIQLNLKRRKQ